MNCPNCQELTETGAAFCGNCGQALSAEALAASHPGEADAHIAQVLHSQLTRRGHSALPAYVLATPAEHAVELKATLSVICGVMGLAATAFMPLVSLLLGLTGTVSATMSRRASRHSVSTSGLVLSVAAVLAGLGMWAYVVMHNPALKRTAALRNAAPISTTTATASSTVDTPCYATGFISSLNVSHSTTDSCDINAYDGASPAASDNLYKVYGNDVSSLNEANFAALAKQAIEKDVRTNLPTFNIDSEQAGLFAGSQALTVNASDTSQNVAVVEAAVLHPETAGYNLFILVHAINGRQVDLSTLEAQWQWK